MIGILGGSFDPVHHGHLRLALEVLEALDFDHVRLIPLNQPNAAKSPIASGTLRLEMLQAAVASEPRLRVDDRELRRGGISYTVDTLQSLREEMPDQPLCLVLGMDAFRGLRSWHQWQRLLTLSHLVIAKRPGAPAPDSTEVGDLLESARVDNSVILQRHICGKIYTQTISQLDISSTQIRERLRSGRSVRYLLPNAVLDIINRHALYQQQE